MSQRDKTKTKTTAAKKAPADAGKVPAKLPAKAPTKAPAKATGQGGPSIESLEARVRTLEAERNALANELAAARASIAKLESARAQVVDRIDWVIDSLKGLVEGEG